METLIFTGDRRGPYALNLGFNLELPEGRGGWQEGSFLGPDPAVCGNPSQKGLMGFSKGVSVGRCPDNPRSPRDHMNKGILHCGCKA